ncbi:type VI secretion system protein TssL, long form [Corallincola platygyrae]|uniref:Type VI secretion system protein TssL, long form n=1 Tax=Corallincola platygyrae TaxID=1193278 RepID=A0ABW4XLD3_9GAMM
MAEATIIKPTPGGRRLNQGMIAPKPTPVSVDSTVLKSESTPVFTAVRIPGLGENKIVDAAGPLLTLATQVRCTGTHTDVPGLQRAVVDMVNEFQSELKRHGVVSELVESAGYSICAFVDETVLNTPWGGNSTWSSKSLLSIFHAETLGGEHFFTLLDRSISEPHKYCQLLGLQYLCLSLGFTGKMRLETRGQQQLDEYRARVFDALNSLVDEPARLNDLSWRDKVVHADLTEHDFPLWVICSLLAMVLLFIYLGFNYSLSRTTSEQIGRLTNLVSWSDSAAEVTTPFNKYLQVEQFLQTEVERGILSVESMPDRLRIVIESAQLFDSGSADIKEGVLPILGKMARTIEGVKTRILITGHTDNQPIFTSKYPSNWHLSLARATAVANILSYSADLEGKLWPEGRGEAEPKFDNSTAQGRAKNRRVEIDLLYR